MRRLSVLASAALLLSGCNGMFFYPSRKELVSLESLKIPFEWATFDSADGTRLTAVFFPAEGAAKGTVVHFHGNAENLTTHFPFAYWLTRRGYNVIAFDYRGYGASSGKPSVRGAIEDGAAALAYARTRPGVDPERLVVFGQSLGAAMALPALARDGGRGVRAVVLEGAFSSFRGMARDRLSRLWLTWPLQWPLSFLFSDRYAPYKSAGRRPPCPILFIHGDSDPIVPMEQARALYEASPSPKEFWTVPGGGHLEAFTRRAGEYRPRLAAFLDKAVK